MDLEFQPLQAILEVVPPVVVLSNSASPPAVIGRVVAVVVDTIQGGAGRTGAHVSHEVVKRVQPAVTDLDTLRSVVLEGGMLVVVAAGLHGGVGEPEGIGLRTKQERITLVGEDFPSQAAAGKGNAVL